MERKTHLVLEGYGLFYSNYSDEKAFESSVLISEMNLKYTMVMGPSISQKPCGVGAYIQDYNSYLSDLALNMTKYTTEPIITELGMFYENIDIMTYNAIMLPYLSCENKLKENEIINLSKKYGIKKGPAVNNTDKRYVGIYVVNYEQFLEDEKNRFNSIKKSMFESIVHYKSVSDYKKRRRQL